MQSQQTTDISHRLSWSLLALRVSGTPPIE